jgi:hypothetical protein
MFPSFIPAGMDADIAKTAGLVMGAIGTGMGLFSSSRPGPLAPQDPAVVVAATALASLSPDSHPDAIGRAKTDLNIAIAGQLTLPPPRAIG